MSCLKTGVDETLFGYLEDGTAVKLFKLTNENGMVVELISYGATVKSIILPNQNGTTTDVCLGFDTLDGYLGKTSPNPYFGCVNGRCANRIKNGEFKLDGVNYKLSKNCPAGPNAVHGGNKAFDKKVWNSTADLNSVSFSYLSSDGEEGYPGDVVSNIVYELTKENALKITFTAMTNKPTLVNMGSHCFFNLGGHQKAGIKGLWNHEFCFTADYYTPLDEFYIPTGEIRSVELDPLFDFRTPKILGDILSKCPNQSMDASFCLANRFCKNNNEDKTELRFVCSVKDVDSGRKMECYSNQPGFQFYPGNFLPTDGSIVGKDNVSYGKGGGFVILTQMYPDSINQENFPDDFILRPGNIYKHEVIYKFFDAC